MFRHRPGLSLGAYDFLLIKAVVGLKKMMSPIGTSPFSGIKGRSQSLPKAKP